MNSTLLLCALLGLVACTVATVHFKEEFDAGWEKRWVESNIKEKEGSQGHFVWSAGKWYGDAENDKGIQAQEDYRFYDISAEIKPEFSNKDKPLVLQYQAKYEQPIDCGGAYIKLLPAGLDQATFGGDSTYNIMFGPDVCGYSTRKVHVIFNYKGKNLLVKKEIKPEIDQLTHLYTLILRPDNTYEVWIDLKEVARGNLAEDFDFLPPKEIKDPSKSKPADWVDEAEIADPEAKKPEDWDAPAQIPDPEAKKPEDWDDELDGEWEAPMIDNPEYKGEWDAPKIPNPAYKGPWVHPLIPNPEYFDDPNLYLYSSNKYVGFELWTVKAGTLFDNIIVTDNVDEAKEFAEATFSKLVEGEKEMKKKKDEEEEAERKKKDEEEAAKRAAEGGDHGHDHGHEDEDEDEGNDEDFIVETPQTGNKDEL